MLGLVVLLYVVSIPTSIFLVGMVINDLVKETQK